MPFPDVAARAVAIAVHDVSPATWPECRELLAMLDDAGASPLSLLVIPHYHYGSVVLREPAFLRAMEARLARGDELVLHGYFHVDDAASPRTPREWFRRRMLTRREGEFAALDERAAARRIDAGIAMFDRLGWPLAGFVPPAWLLSPGTRAALSRYGGRFDYVTVRSGIFHLPGWRFERTANVWYSPDSALRRAISTCLIAREQSRASRAPLLRLSLHPQDARVRSVVEHWRGLVADALAERRAVTKGEWVRAAQVRTAQPRFAYADGHADARPARAVS
ncbi:MAG TPA: polysaccharide deacetylase family protein [Casimicrobiaceae bacterium]